MLKSTQPFILHGSLLSAIALPLKGESYRWFFSLSVEYLQFRSFSTNRQLLPIYAELYRPDLGIEIRTPLKSLIPQIEYLQLSWLL